MYSCPERILDGDSIRHTNALCEACRHIGPRSTDGSGHDVTRPPSYREAVMRNRFVSTVFFVFVLTCPSFGGDLTRGLEITVGQNVAAQLKLERVHDAALADDILKVRVSLAQVTDLKGYGLSLQFDSDRYEFLEARELDGNLLKSGPGQQTVFLASDRVPGKLDVGAVKVDGASASGDGKLVDLVFKTGDIPVSGDFQIVESVLVGLDNAIEQITHIAIGDLRPLPDAYGMDRNAPNPFNPSTVIGYQLPEAGQVRMVVYNLLGQEVRVLVNERMEAGDHKATWDGADVLGRRVASGIYFYRMQAGGFSATQRMLLLK